MPKVTPQGFESAEAAVAFAATLPLGEGSAHLEQALVNWPKSAAIKAELERYDAEIRATPNDAMPAGEPVTTAGLPLPPAVEPSVFTS